MTATYELENDAYRLTVRAADKGLHVRVDDCTMGVAIADGQYIYRAAAACDAGAIVVRWLTDVVVKLGQQRLTITGMLAGLEIVHGFSMPADRPVMEEQITLHNTSRGPIRLADFACGMQRRIANEVGAVLPEVWSDRIVAIPFRHRADDSPGWDNDFDMTHFLTHAGRELRVTDLAPLAHGHGYVPSRGWFSEGWAWSHGQHTLGVFKFNQEAMEFSVLSAEVDPAGVALRFAGAGTMSGEPSALGSIQPGQTVELGVTRLQTVRGGFTSAAYAFRAFLDENGCRFPDGFNPPVHWNELYDNPEWSLGTAGSPPGRRMTRPFTYSKEHLLEEASKARDYGCESLYLDPGWDTDFATFLWGEEWLGSRRDFIQEVTERYGLRVSLHCPLATWLSWDGRGVSSWPPDSFRLDRQGNVIEGSVCLGSQQYLDEAERRLLAHCADGVVYLMFDGNWWNGGCWNPEHDHPIPYTMEDHCRANLDLAGRIHGEHPDVLIEMHDMITGGSITRYTPVYYKYGLAGSYDENWGFELMWQPFDDIVSGSARALYYYNLACNVPIYLHVDLRDDNEHCLVFWWYASTCRHLGIGATHEGPIVAEAHKRAMARYRRLDPFYKRGDFYGISEEIHVHALPEQNAFVANLFNLSDDARVVTGAIGLEEMGLDRDRWYVTPYTHAGGGFDRDAGNYVVCRRLAPWSAQVVEVCALDTGPRTSHSIL